MNGRWCVSDNRSGVCPDLVTFGMQGHRGRQWSGLLDWKSSGLGRSLAIALALTLALAPALVLGLGDTFAPLVF